MFGGIGTRWINFDGLSTHQLINEIAYKHALKGMPKKGFPSMITIDLHSGFYGPDGIWTKDNVGKVSHHMYNPTDDTGQAVDCAIDALKIAAHHITSRNKLNKKAANLALARGLHFVVDALTPAHHYGHYIPEAKEGVDWFDPHWQRNRGNAFNILFRAHGQFEFKCARVMFFNTKKIRKNYKQLRKDRPITEISNPEDLRHFLKQKARQVRETRIYEHFLEGEQIRREIRDELFPEIIHAVEIYIRSIYATARLKKKNGRLRIPKVRIPRMPNPANVKSAVLQGVVSAKSKVRSAGRKMRDKSGTGKSDQDRAG